MGRCSCPAMRETVLTKMYLDVCMFHIQPIPGGFGLQPSRPGMMWKIWASQSLRKPVSDHSVWSFSLTIGFIITNSITEQSLDIFASLDLSLDHTPNLKFSQSICPLNLNLLLSQEIQQDLPLRRQPIWWEAPHTTPGASTSRHIPMYLTSFARGDCLLTATTRRAVERYGGSLHAGWYERKRTRWWLPWNFGCIYVGFYVQDSASQLLHQFNFDFQSVRSVRYHPESRSVEAGCQRRVNLWQASLLWRRGEQSVCSQDKKLLTYAKISQKITFLVLGSLQTIRCLWLHCEGESEFLECSGNTRQSGMLYSFLACLTAFKLNVLGLCDTDLLVGRLCEWMSCTWCSKGQCGVTTDSWVDARPIESEVI